MLHTPTLCLETLEKIMALSLETFAANLGLNNEHLADSAAMSPGTINLKILLINLTSKVVLQMIKQMKGKDISLLCDKDGGNSKAYF